MAQAYRTIARVTKTHGRRGEVVAVSAHGLPPLLREGLEVALVPPPLRGPRWFVVDGVQDGGTGQLVHLRGIDALGDASLLVGRYLLARAADLPEDLALHDVDALMGREVRDVRLGDLGTICEVMRGPAQDVWVVRGNKGEVLVPVVRAMVVDVPQEGAIVVDLPRGLVDEGA